MLISKLVGLGDKEVTEAGVERYLSGEFDPKIAGSVYKAFVYWGISSSVSTTRRLCGRHVATHRRR